jgi:hypothetical protein
MLMSAEAMLREMRIHARRDQPQYVRQSLPLHGI